ncbi:ABC transporter ATP-binding protein [Pelagibius marinus]|uniref:ABC transporter ATP-binding protein n=1 Tax=Pelagibius marinus TaxID=2762760 RepID=UPI002AC36166|nr:ABC transporter ATP-binding protein [Pelagibius marinus]
MTAFIELSGVTMSYGGAAGALPAVADATLHIERGEFVALVGPSGCGKSSLLKIVSGLAKANSGHARIDGREIAGSQASGGRASVGMAFQNATMLPWRSTLENVLLPLEVSRDTRATFRRKKAEHIEAARNLLKVVGLEGYEDHAPYELSGGMQQRASLCRALIHGPELLLLDEPFAALDAFTREELWDVLQNLWLQRKFTVILVTHDLREAAYLADRVYVMSKRPGRIVYERPVALPRPRSLETTFEEDFVALVHVLRDHISEVRAA